MEKEGYVESSYINSNIQYILTKKWNLSIWTMCMNAGGFLYLSSQLFHERLQFAEEVITLVEERQMGIHERQHL